MKSYSRDQAKSEMGDGEKPESDGRELFLPNTAARHEEHDR